MPTSLLRKKRFYELKPSKWKEKVFVQLDYKNIPLVAALGTLPRKGSRFFSRNVSHALIENMIKAEKPGRLREEMSREY